MLKIIQGYWSAMTSVFSTQAVLFLTDLKLLLCSGTSAIAALGSPSVESSSGPGIPQYGPT